MIALLTVRLAHKFKSANSLTQVSILILLMFYSQSVNVLKWSRRHSIIIQQINATTMSQNYLTLKYAMQNKN